MRDGQTRVGGRGYKDQRFAGVLDKLRDAFAVGEAYLRAGFMAR